MADALGKLRLRWDCVFEGDGSAGDIGGVDIQKCLGVCGFRNTDVDVLIHLEFLFLLLITVSITVFFGESNSHIWRGKTAAC